MDEKDEAKGDHYAIRAENLAPARIFCKCGAVFVGNEAIEAMQAHMKAHDNMAELERHLVLRNVFDKDDKDEESP